MQRSTQTEPKPLTLAELLVIVAILAVVALLVGGLWERHKNAGIIEDEPIVVIVTDNPRRLEVEPGAPVRLKASFVQEENQYQWKKDGRPITGATTSVLEMKVKKDDTGKYSCVIKKGEQQ